MLYTGGLSVVNDEFFSFFVHYKEDGANGTTDIVFDLVDSVRYNYSDTHFEQLLSRGDHEVLKEKVFNARIFARELAKLNKQEENHLSFVHFTSSEPDASIEFKVKGTGMHFFLFLPNASQKEAALHAQLAHLGRIKIDIRDCYGLKHWEMLYDEIMNHEKVRIRLVIGGHTC